LCLSGSARTLPEHEWKDAEAEDFQGESVIGVQNPILHELPVLFHAFGDSISGVVSGLEGLPEANHDHTTILTQCFLSLARGRLSNASGMIRQGFADGFSNSRLHGSPLKARPRYVDITEE
jgi:hypothetical protein